MKIFLSHSSKNKPLVREIKSYLPDHIKLWIDEKDLLIGDNIENSIKNAIETKSDFIIIIIDSFSINSSWVIKELNWALKREKDIGRAFILPVVIDIDKSILNEKLPELDKVKYLTCLDYTENSIQSLSNSIISQLFAWLSRDLNTNSNLIEQPDTTIKLLDDADHFTAKTADHIRLKVYSYRRENPLEIEKLYDLLKISNDFSKLTYAQFNKLLTRLQQQGYLAGIVCDGINIFVEEEHFAWKTAVHSDSKKRIAKKAISLIKSGYTIAMDAGSTTLEVARQIGNGLKMKAWKNLNVITNSISAANELLNVSAEMGWDDSSTLINVYIIGGRIRPNTLAVINDDLDFKRNFNDGFKNITTLIGRADVAFIGCNGVDFDYGLTTHSSLEVDTKIDIISFSERIVVLTDPSKFGIREDKPFASFDNPMEIITVADDYEETIKSFVEHLQNTKTKIILA